MQAGEPCPRKSDPRPENRVVGSGGFTYSCTWSTWSQTPDTRREIETTSTTTVSGALEWLSKDPIGISGGLNQYVAFNNNPVNERDPFGLVPTNDPNELRRRQQIVRRMQNVVANSRTLPEQVRKVALEYTFTYVNKDDLCNVRSRKQIGMHYGKRKLIELSSYYWDKAGRFDVDLFEKLFFHEIQHGRPTNQHHGPQFYAEVDRLADMFLMSDVSLIGLVPGGFQDSNQKLPLHETVK